MRPQAFPTPPSRPAAARTRRRRLSVGGVVAAAVILVLAVAVLPHIGGSEHKSRSSPAGLSDPTVSLASNLAAAMARPWPGLQARSGHFNPGVGGGSRYGDAMLGYALLQDGLRRGNAPLARSGLRAIAYVLPRAELHNARGGSPSIFEGVALASAYNLARAHFGHDPAFARMKPAWQRVLRHITLIRLPLTTYYGNHWLVEAIEVRELLKTGIRSREPYAVLGGWRTKAAQLSEQLVNERIPAMERGQAARVHHRRAFLLSDPPDNPLAYQGLSLGLYARAVRLLGHRASPAARRTLVDVANASLWLTAPDGDVAYFGRNQEEAWSLSATAYGAAVAARMPHVGAGRAASLRTLARRALLRLRDRHGVGPNGLHITPGVKESPVAGERGIDPGAGGAPFAALTLAITDWSVPSLAAGPRRLGSLPLDRNGSAVLARGESQFAVVRRGPVWFAVRGAPSGKHPYDLRDDFGLVAVKRLAGGRWADAMALHPITNAKPDTTGPVPVSPRGRLFPVGDTMRVSRSGTVTVGGSYRTAPSPFKRLLAHLPNDTWVDALGFRPGALVQAGASWRFRPTACGVTTSFTTRAGQRYEYSQFFRARPHIRGTSLLDPRSTLSLGSRAKVSIEDRYSSGLDPRLWRARLEFPPSNGKPIALSLCASSSSPSPPPSP